MLAPIEELILWFSKATSVMGGALAFLADSVTSGAVAFLALLLNWFYARRRDRREQEKHNLEMGNNEQY